MWMTLLSQKDEFVSVIRSFVMKFSEYIVKRLKQLGHDYVFGVPGSYIMPIWQRCNKMPQAILARHEAGAAFIAEGWSRLTMKPGVVLTTIGPGISNVVTGAFSAYKDSVPLLIITGQADTSVFNTGVFQECNMSNRGFEPQKLMQQVTKHSIEITQPETAVEQFEYAYHLATDKRPGPVHVSLPLNIQNHGGIVDTGCYKVERVTNCLDPLELFAAIDKLQCANRVLIIAGWGCYLSNVSFELEELAQILNAPLITTVKGLACVADNFDYFVGHIGPGGRTDVISFIKQYQPDCVLSLGTSLDKFYIAPIQDIIESAYCIHVDIDEGQLQLRKPLTDLSLYADINSFVNRLLQELQIKCSDESMIDLISENKLARDMQPLEENNKQYMAAAIRKIASLIPPDTIVIPDAGNHWLNVLTLHKILKPNTLYVNTGSGCMGFAIGAAIGMKLARPAQKVICITGDASVLMFGNEVTVAKELQLDIIFIVINNGSHARIRTAQQLDFDNNIVATDIDRIDFALWGNAYNIKTHTVTCYDEFISAIKCSLKSNNTSLIDVRVDKNEIPVCLQEIK
jgi:acetolactate synthase-1/2/3 large subunit